MLSDSDKLTDFAHAFGVRLMVMTPKERVDPVMKKREFRTGCFEQCVVVAAPCAVHQLDGNLHLCAANLVELHQLAELFEVRRLRVERFALEGSNHRRFNTPVAGLEVSNPGFDLLCDFRGCWRAIAG